MAGWAEIKDSSQGTLVAIFIAFSKAFDSVNWTWISAVLLHYYVPEELVEAVMSMYYGAKAKVNYSNDQFTNFIDLSIGVLQGNSLAPYLLVIVVDYVMRVALAGQSLGLKIINKVETTTRIKTPAKYITDLDFADDIMLISDDAINSQKQLDSVDIMARKVGSKINRAKTEFMMVGNWASPIEFRVSTGSIQLVKDFKYLGSWLLNSTKDFEIRKTLAWKACIRLVKIWKSHSISTAVKMKLFRACVESTFLYNAVTWTLTDTLSRKLDGCYTKLLRYALNHFTE
jgi:Reverse transcriptase (RNA-dependent DNA polymerase)